MAIRKQPQELPSPPSTMRSNAPYFLFRAANATVVCGGLFSVSVKVNQEMSGLTMGLLMTWTSNEEAISLLTPRLASRENVTDELSALESVYPSLNWSAASS